MSLNLSVNMKQIARALFNGKVQIRHLRFCSQSAANASSERQESNRMSAWEVHSYGKLEELRLSCASRIPIRTNDTQLVVRVLASSVNPIDVLMLGGYGSVFLNSVRKLEGYCLHTDNTIEFPLILGRDFCGEVVSKGVNVKNSKVGDIVWGVLPPHKQGSHAQMVLADDAWVVRKPSNLNNVEAGSVLYTAVTAWSALKLTGDMFLLPARGKKVLVIGGSGGVGVMAVQLLKAWGAEVVTTCNTDAVSLLQSLGADVIIDYTDVNAEDSIKQAGKYDIILDAAGLGADKGLKYAQYLKTLNFAKYITLRSPLLKNVDEFGIIGGMLKNVADLLTPNIQTGIQNCTSSIRWGFFIPSTTAIHEITELVEQGKVIPCVEKVYPFTEVPSAYERMKAGHLRGKVVIDHECMAKLES